MEKKIARSEQIDTSDRDRRDEALANPENFFPQPEDVLKDDTLSADEKRTLLHNWRVLLEDRGGTLEPGTHAVNTKEDDRALFAAVADALAKLEDHRES